MPSTIWHDLDDHLQFDACLEHFKADQVRNFAVQFDAGHARCAVDVDQDVVEALLETDRTGEQSRTTHWLNFWSGARDAAAITSIAKKYGVPPRLASLLHTQRPPKPSQSARAPCSPRTDFASRMRSADIETGVAEVELSPKVAPQSRAPGFGDVIDSLWHFCSVDRGPQYIYVGFNAIFALPGVEQENQNDFSKPFGVRIWTSLLLCSDGTVVSIYEQPPSHIPRDFINNMRSNVLNNLRHLSKNVMSASPNSLMHISVRPDLSSEQVSTEDSDSPALLVYYLFDDWATTYALITQQHNPYRERLRQIRQVMFDAADMDLIKSLDLVGRQLMALKLIYQSYDTTIRQILKHGGAEHRGSWDALSYASGPNMSYFQRSSQPSGLNLPPCTIDRFERLLDRIRLYALTEIDECLKQKESLVFMNFNLLTLKQSQAFEKLTRITVLLAKVTILFLPVSLMTGYFSVQIPEVANRYSLTTYWSCFTIVVVASVLVLACFSQMAGRAGGKTMYRSLTRTVWDKFAQNKTKKV